MAVIQQRHEYLSPLSGIVKVAKAQKNTDDINDYYLKSEGTNEHQNYTA